MSAVKTPQAFPMATGTPHNGGDWVDGMDLRDWFAGQALAGGLASGAPIDGADPEHRKELAETVYALADALLAARKVQS